jgi:uncharacterized coiled-coil protein SlyX
MMTLGQAAKATGKGKTTLVRAIQAGRLSATRRDDGGYEIDPSELARAYNVTPQSLESVHRVTPRDPELETRLAVAEAELSAMKDMLAEVRTSRDHWQAQAERLALAPPAQISLPTPERARRSWWRRLAG